MIYPKEKRVAKIMERLATPMIERDPQSDEQFCKKLGFSYVTYLSDKKKIEEAWAKGDITDEVTKYMKRLEELALIGRNPKFMEMLLKIKNIYKEKSEVKIDLTLSAEDLIRRNLRAEAELNAEGYGVEEVPNESPVLPEELRLGTGQDKTGDSPMAGVESSNDSGESCAGVAQPTIPPNPTLSDSVQVSADRT